MSEPHGEYETELRETLAEAPGLRVRRLMLSAGQQVPWHSHSHITDTFICLAGPMRVTTRHPDAVHELGAGEMLTVPPSTPHLVTGIGDGTCSFVIIQGVGEYDYVALDDTGDAPT